MGVEDDEVGTLSCQKVYTLCDSRIAGSTSAHQNQFPEMPSVTTRPAIASGVSAANVVATSEVPAIHQGNDRPATKNSVVFAPARRACHAPHARASTRYAATSAASMGSSKLRRGLEAAEVGAELPAWEECQSERGRSGSSSVAMQPPDGAPRI